MIISHGRAIARSIRQQRRTEKYARAHLLVQVGVVLCLTVWVWSTLACTAWAENQVNGTYYAAHSSLNH